MTRTGARFRQVEPRHRARAFVLGMLAELPPKDCRTIAGHATPDGMQHLLARAKWDADGVRDDLRSYVSEQRLSGSARFAEDQRCMGDLAFGGRKLLRLLPARACCAALRDRVGVRIAGHLRLRLGRSPHRACITVPG